MASSRTPYSLEIQALLAAATRKRFAAKSTIVQEGQVPTDLYFILSGSVTVIIEDAEGNELILAYLGPGQFFGELGLFSTSAKRSAYVCARSKCEIAQIGYDRVKALIHARPELLLQLVAQIAERLRATSRKLGHLAFLDVTGRIARALLDLSGDSQAIAHPDGMLLHMTREELARLVNCSAKMTSRVLRDLEQQGLIQVQGKRIIVMEISMKKLGREKTTPPADTD